MAVMVAAPLAIRYVGLSSGFSSRGMLSLVCGVARGFLPSQHRSDRSGWEAFLGLVDPLTCVRRSGCPEPLGFCSRMAGHSSVFRRHGPPWSAAGRREGTTYSANAAALAATEGLPPSDLPWVCTPLSSQVPIGSPAVEKRWASRAGGCRTRLPHNERRLAHRSLIAPEQGLCAPIRLSGAPLPYRRVTSTTGTPSRTSRTVS